MTVMASCDWPSNAELIRDVATLGYLRADWLTLDPTYGQGTFWKLWRPEHLTCTDIIPAFLPLNLDPQCSIGYSTDFTALPFLDRSFDCVVFDPPYKLNGTPDETVDARYGVHTPRTWQQRMTLIRDGLTECARVLGDGFLLLKCQDQVCSGKVRWQTFEFTEHVRGLGLGLVDRFDFPSYRPQPERRRQVHAHGRGSTLLVFKRGWSSSDLERRS